MFPQSPSFIHVSHRANLHDTSTKKLHAEMQYYPNSLKNAYIDSMSNEAETTKKFARPGTVNKKE